MTSSIMDENSNSVLDYNFLASMGHDEPDILDEFLDQRVYDSLGNNTPVPQGSSASLTNHSKDPESVKQEPADMLQEFYQGSSFAGPSGNFSAIAKHPSQSSTQSQTQNSNTPDNEYLYIDPSQYTKDNSVYASPFDHKTQASLSVTSVDGDNMIIDTDDSHKHKSSSQLSDHDIIRDELSKLKFGNHFMNPCPARLDVPDPSYLDFSPEAMAKLPYTLELHNLPKYSRVETQIKLKFTLSSPPPNALLYIPQDLISKNKFCLNQPLDSLSPKLKENLLYLDAYVLTSNLKKSCNICSRCIKREQKRASRIKAGFNESDSRTEFAEPPTTGLPMTAAGVVKNNPNSWADDKMIKKAIIFNCKEIMSFPAPNGLEGDSSKSLELSARIICYCRHHKEPSGFKLLFVITNSSGNVVAKHISTPIVIMDRKKNLSSKNDESIPNSVAGSSTNLKGLGEMDITNDKPNKANSIISNNSDSDLYTSPHALQSRNSAYSTPHQNNSPEKHSPQALKHEPQNEQQPQVSAEEILSLHHPLSPNSIDESASEPQTNTDSNEARGVKRKKLSVDDSFNSSSNPMFNGSVSGFSPMSNSDTNTSTTNNFSLMKSNANALGNPLDRQFNLVQQPVQGSSTQQTLPSIQRIIPAQGPIRGGIEVTLLGFNFRPGLSVKFGATQALATHCWSETTIVTYLPPATQAGQVLVSFENHEAMMLGGAQQQQIFTYTDDTDRQLIELALQIVGLKMNGKLEDAKNIARRIVGTDNSGASGVNSATAIGGSQQQGGLIESSGSQDETINQANIEWFDSAHKAVEQLTKSDLSTEEILISFLSLVDLPNCPIIIPNWQLCNKQGQTLLHLSTLKKYTRLIKFLISHGCKIDLQDNQGLTPLFLASMCGHRDLIKVFLDCKSNWNLKLSNDKYLKDYCDLNVLDIFNELDHDAEDFGNVLSKDSKEDKLSKSVSLDSLNSMLTMSYGRHISKMVMDESVESLPKEHESSGDRHTLRKSVKSPVISSFEESNYSSEFADSEFESNDDELDETDDYEDDYEDDYDSESVHSVEANETLVSSSILGSSSASVEDTDDQSSSTIRQQGLWQKVKNVFNADDSDTLPSYDDLFPFGPSSFQSKPKTQIERTLNESETLGPRTGSSKQMTCDQDDAGTASDSSEDMVVSFINHPRKTVENDKMLLFFWFPVLISIMACFFLISIMGYRIEMIENVKVFIRDTIGNMMVGNERIGRVFKTNDGAVLRAAGAVQ